MKKVKGFLLIGMVMLVAVGAYLVAGTYAKYTHVVTKTGAAEVAAWAFDTDNADGTLTMALDPTVDTTTLVSERIAPGTSGAFDIALSNANSEVGVDVTVTPIFSGENVPENLKFYKTGTCSVGEGANKTKAECDTAGGTWTLSEEVTTLEAEIGIGDDFAGKIYWQWVYETASTDYKAVKEINATSDWISGTGSAIAVDGDVSAANYALLTAVGQAKCISLGDWNDTNAGSAAAAQTGDVSITLNIVGSQRNPNSTTTTSTAWN